MSRPQIVVNVTPALPRRGNDSDTGTTMLAYAGATGSQVATRCRSVADATATGAPDQILTWVGDALSKGAPEIVLTRVTAVDTAAVTEAEWKTGLEKFSDEFGAGQVIIPGVSTAAAHAALLDHAADNAERCVLLDSPTTPTGSALTATAVALAAADGAERATIITWATLAAPGATTRNVPGSVLAAGLVGRGDAYSGHANNAPILDQSHGAGFILGTPPAPHAGVPKIFTNAELDALHDAGVSVIRPIRGVVQLAGWRALSDDDRFRQLNWGRFTMELKAGLSLSAQKFLGRQIDGRGHLFSELEGMLRGYLTEMWRKDALYGDSADDAFEVEVAAVNTAETIAAGELHASCAVALTAHTEKVVFDIVTYTTEGISA